MKNLLSLACLLVMSGCSGCGDGGKDSDTGLPPLDDADYDGWTVQDGDCDDHDADTHPGATETYYDGVDQDCDGYDADDQDADGWAFADDCDDLDPDVHPEAAESCNGTDDDCDGSTDEDAVDASAGYADADADGYGDAAAPVAYCGTVPEGVSTDATDCNDADAGIHPNAPELCDDVDNDCDTQVDEDNPDPVTWYFDGDGDGHGDPGVTVVECTPPAQYVDIGDDCDDGDASTYPGAPESCDAVDHDCDGDATNDPVDGEDWYTDADGDGYGDPETAVTSCEPVPDAVANGDDCDDTTDTIHPDAEDVCDGYDNNCDDTIDEGNPTSPWYADDDGDTFGDSGDAILACVAPEGYVGDSGDCADDDADIHPGAEERCNGADDDCDGDVDEGATDLVTWYDDDDDDGFGDPTTGTVACSPPADTVDNAGDCDDTNGAIYPGAPESCDTFDNDCDGDVDEPDAVDASPWYRDADVDGYGDPADFQGACDQPPGYVANASDCDDGDADTWPGAAETCDGEDDDCDGDIDEGTPTTPWYRDADGDGFGTDTDTVEACGAPLGYVAASGDCDDTEAAISPDGVETCDGVDNDCDGAIDVDAVDAVVSYGDGDGDGYGDPSSGVTDCDSSGRVLNGDDCDDLDEAVNPGAEEACNGWDDDCDDEIDEPGATGSSTWYQDADGDTFGGDVSVVACSAADGWVATTGDCDDGNADAFPGATEVCDGVDDDCDGDIDEIGAVGEVFFYEDGDGDGHGIATSTRAACSVPDGYAALDDDCDDAHASAYPGAAERCDTIDNDCDTEIDEAGALGEATAWADDDVDGYGDPTRSVTACTVPSDWVDNGDDCDDLDPTVNPDAVEACNGWDDDCDSLTDEAGALGERTFYLDDDGDAYGVATDTAVACDTPAGYADTGGDCDPTDPYVWPGAPELCDAQDNDCDGVSTDEVGTASVESGDGTWQDVTAALAAGTAADPAFFGDGSYDVRFQAGTLWMCDGTWYVKGVFSDKATTASIIGRNGAAVTTLSAGGSLLGSIIAISSSTLYVEGVTVTDGLGSNGGTQGGGIIVGKTTAGKPATPNLTLVDSVVTGNHAEYGGGIALIGNAWVDLVDTVITGNDADVAGGGVWFQGEETVDCTATSLGAGSIDANVAPYGGGVYLSGVDIGEFTSTGCDWGEDDAGDDNATYDIQLNPYSDPGYCYLDPADPSETVTCTLGVCTASTDGTCP